MRNWRKWRSGNEQRSERARKAANARWDACRAANASEPIRRDRVVELTIRDTHRPMFIIRLQAHETPRGWSRWQVTENGKQVGRRRWGTHAVAAMIARSLQ